MGGLINFLVAIVVLFGGGVLAMRWLSGWGRLETHYRKATEDPTKIISEGSFRWVSCSLRWTGLSLAVELYPQCLWLGPGFPFNIGLKPVCVPWSSIEAVEVRRTLFLRRTAIRIAGIPWAVYMWGEPGEQIRTVFERTRAAKWGNAQPGVQPDAA
jgi:hypothetical protein